MSNSTDLYIYEQNESSKPSILLESKHSFPISGGDSAHCHMAVLGDFVYFGTSASPVYAQMNYKTLTTRTATICTPAPNMTSITASDKLVVVSQQGPVTGCFQSFNDKGQSEMTGGETADTFAASNNAISL